MLDGEHGGEWHRLPRGHQLLGEVGRERRIGDGDIVRTRAKSGYKLEDVRSLHVGFADRTECSNVLAEHTE